MIVDWLDSLALTIGPGWACCVFALAIIVGLPVCLAVGIGLFCFCGLVFDEWNCTRRMRRRGRLLSIDDAKRKIKAEKGTLILEYPYLGWNVNRAWWTADDIADIAPMPPRSLDDLDDDLDVGLEDFDGRPFTEWAIAEYSSESTGKANLVSTWSSEGVVDLLLAEFPELKKIRVDSQLVDFIQPETSNT